MVRLSKEYRGKKRGEKGGNMKNEVLTSIVGVFFVVGCMCLVWFGLFLFCVVVVSCFFCCFV